MDLERENHESSQEAGGSITRSPDAAIGSLMRILKNAPGLRERLPTAPGAPVPQEPSSLQRVMTEEHGRGASSSASRTAADALEELNRYKEIRELILNRGKGNPCYTKLEEKPTDGDP